MNHSLSRSKEKVLIKIHLCHALDSYAMRHLLENGMGRSAFLWAKKLFENFSWNLISKFWSTQMEGKDWGNHVTNKLNYKNASNKCLQDQLRYYMSVKGGSFSSLLLMGIPIAYLVKRQWSVKTSVAPNYYHFNFFMSSVVNLKKDANSWLYSCNLCNFTARRKLRS